jgi:D-glycero-D-manno-heptose 1,7-bisphosphate phosphatase
MRLLIVDRDGVINEDSPEFIKSPAEWIPIPGSLEALAAATQMGFSVFVVSNQSGIARGLVDIEQLNQIHARMVAEVQRCGGRIDAILYCPHGPDDGCDCRKPKPGLLEAIASRTGAALRDAIFVGDRQSDLDAAHAVGARAVLVETGHGRSTAAKLPAHERLAVYPDLAAVVNRLRSPSP